MKRYALLVGLLLMLACDNGTTTQDTDNSVDESKMGPWTKILNERVTANMGPLVADSTTVGVRTQESVVVKYDLDNLTHYSSKFTNSGLEYEILETPLVMYDLFFVDIDNSDMNYYYINLFDTVTTYTDIEALAVNQDNRKIIRTNTIEKIVEDVIYLESNNIDTVTFPNDTTMVREVSWYVNRTTQETSPSAPTGETYYDRVTLREEFLLLK